MTEYVACDSIYIKSKIAKLTDAVGEWLTSEGEE